MSLPQRPGLIYTMPVLDVLVLILVFPLLGSSFSTDAGVKLELQDTSHRFKRLENSIILTIKGGEKREVYINRRVVDEKKLLEELAVEAKNWNSGGKVNVIYRVDKQVPSGYKDSIADMLLGEGYQVYNAGNAASK